MSRFAAINLAKLPAPDVVETISFEAVLAGMIADLQARDPAFTALLESDPAIKILEVAAYREILLRQRVNEAAQAVMLAHAVGSDLDHLAALFGVERLLVSPGDPEARPPVPPVYETDDRLRARTQLALEGFSTAGPEGAYIFHALAASPLAKDIAVTSPLPGEVVVTVLSTEGDGSTAEREDITGLEALFVDGKCPIEGVAVSGLVIQSQDGTTTYAAGIDYVYEAASSTLLRLNGGAIAEGAVVRLSYQRAGLLELVRTALADDDVRPLTDAVTVQGAVPVSYAVAATLTLAENPDMSVVAAQAREDLTAYVEAAHRLGGAVTVSGLHAALTVPGVHKVDLASPVGDVTTTDAEAPYCTSVSLTVVGV